MKIMTLQKIALTSTLLALGACGGGSDSGNNGDTGTFSLNITDAPVDGATAVVVEFTGVTLKPDEGEDEVFEFDPPKSIDLLKLQGTLSEPLLEGVEIPEGTYNQIRLHVNAEFDSIEDSYIDLSDGGREELRVPSGSQSGLKLNSPFTVDADTADAVYTIDFDLRKSVINPRGQPGHFLKPVLRLVQNLDVRSISGTVHPDLVVTDCSGAVYAFEGPDAEVDDVGSANEPVATALVSLDDVSGDYVYELGFMHTGEYTLAFTCEADQDNVEDDAGNPVDDDIAFSDAIVADISVDSVTDADFPAPAP